MNDYRGLERQQPEVSKALEKWRPLLFSWARKLNCQDEMDYDDVMQDAIEWIVWAKREYNEDKKCDFTSWAYRAIQQYFNNKLKSRYAMKSVENKVVLSYDLCFNLGTVVAEPYIIYKEEMEKLISSLSSNGKVIISVLCELENEYSEKFWDGFYKKRDDVIEIVRIDGKKRLSIVLEKYLMEYLKLSKVEMGVFYNEISAKVGGLHELG